MKTNVRTGRTVLSSTNAGTIIGRLLVCLALLSPSAWAASVITLNFNATAIPADGRSIWFSSVFNPSGIPTTGLTHLYITGGTLTFDTGPVVTVPNMTITFDPSLNANISGSAALSFNTGTGAWEETLPVSGLSGNRFLDGVGWQVTAPSGNANVAWSMNFMSDRSGISLNWQAAAAVYPTFGTSLNALGVKPVDDNQASIYLNSDHSGTPENFKGNVTGGATGGGGSNFTGSYSPTVNVTVPVPEPASAWFLVLGFGVLGIIQRRRQLGR